MPNRTERYDAVAHSVIGAIKLSFDELLGPAVSDPGCSVVSQLCHRQILPDFQGLGFQRLDFSSLGLGCEFVIDFAPMNSDVPGSADADPHLIAAHLGDGNLVRMPLECHLIEREGMLQRLLTVARQISVPAFQAPVRGLKCEPNS